MRVEVRHEVSHPCWKDATHYFGRCVSRGKEYDEEINNDYGGVRRRQAAAWSAYPVGTWRI
jgi:hypothetical protein